jgi:hypothetical protein
LPLIVFVEKETRRDANGSGVKLRVLCLDSRTGQSVYRNEDLPDTGIGQFRVRSERQGDPAVLIEMSNRLVRLTATSEPRPPEPPANDDLVAAREFTERGLRAVARQLGNALQESSEDNQDAARGNRRRANRRGGE